MGLMIIIPNIVILRIKQSNECKVLGNIPCI